MCLSPRPPTTPPTLSAHSDQKLGGAVFNSNGYMAFKNGSLFNENSAASNGDAGDGGAIYNFDGGEIT